MKIAAADFIPIAQMIELRKRFSFYSATGVNPSQINKDLK